MKTSNLLFRPLAAVVVLHASGTTRDAVSEGRPLHKGHTKMKRLWIACLMVSLVTGAAWVHQAVVLAVQTQPTTLPMVRPTLEQEIEKFLHEYYEMFEMSEPDRTKALERAAAGVTEDYTAIFFIPSQKKELLHFDKKTILEGFAQAFALYQGKHPVMTVTNVQVLSRSENEAVASYQMNFYLEGQLRNDALAIADLRREGGSWRMYRTYENKRR